MTLIFGMLCAPPAGAEERPLYLDPSQTVESRARDLVSRMTLDEKVSQMMNNAPSIPRLGVPEYDWWNECLHGVARAGRATVFPQAIGLAATFDAALVERIASAIGDEARAKHHAFVQAGRRGRYRGLTFWTPNINIFRDPRWGRGQETYGEDPELTARIGAAFVRGLQGDHPRYLKAAACAKHYAVHSGPEGERHRFDAVVSLKDLRETYLHAFRALVDAGVEAVMCAYNRTNGVPCCGHKELLIDVLRDEWGFRGHIVSDCGALRDFDERHKVTGTNAESAALALRSGTNLNCGDTYGSLLDAVKQGLVTEDEIDVSLATLLATRFRLGLFDPEDDNPYAGIGMEVVGSQEHRELAREAARKSIVLLKNENGTLPLSRNLDKIYVAGPVATDVQALLGNYYGASENLATILEGVIGHAGPTTVVEYRQGALLDRPNVSPPDRLARMARDADVTVVALGLTPLLEGEEGNAIASPDKGDRLDIGLPANQIEFLRKVRASARKLVVVLTGGSPMTIAEVHDLADAVLLAWYPGQEGGHAVADVLFGDVSPSGRLPVTFPKSLADLPPFEDYGMNGRTYRYMTAEPLYPFGFGLSYTRFTYGPLALDRRAVTRNESVMARVNVANTGEIPAEEVVQLYLTDVEASAPAPLAALKGFQRVMLAPGESRQVVFTIAPEMMSLVDERGRETLEAGRFRVTAGGAAPGARAVALGAPKPAQAEFRVNEPPAAAR
ncbi:MAG: glycoside hydrolase family 3 C-terminal domain-containing protein [Vicinamibacteria bacterium]|nr:glycoside hydrolase family 3 C-terminal domain-containing protein [Vicinamibacteria bacterium]